MGSVVGVKPLSEDIYNMWETPLSASKKNSENKSEQSQDLQLNFQPKLKYLDSAKEAVSDCKLVA